MYMAPMELIAGEIVNWKLDLIPPLQRDGVYGVEV
jgi:hypothetical protein